MSAHGKNNSASLEIEIKLRVSDHAPVRAKLKECGAEFRGRAMETNWILDRVDGSLRESGCGLRVRKAVNDETGATKCSLTFKGPARISKVKSREELEVVIDDAGLTVRILESLGFGVRLEYTKRRESWVLDDCKVELDEPPRLGLFVEIEGPEEELIERVRAKLGLDGAQVEKTSYVAMLMRE